MKLERCNPNPFGLCLSKRPSANPNPFGLSLSKPTASIRQWPLRHRAFDKLSPLLRANGCCCQGERMFHASRVALENSARPTNLGTPMHRTLETNMSKTAEFFFDVGSPASYLAWTQLPAICAQTSATLVYRPMLLGGVFQATGNSSPATIPSKGAYTHVDYARHARRYGVPYRSNPHFPIITLALMRAATGVQLKLPERFQDFLRSIFQALWVDALNLNEPALVAQTLVGAGFDAQAVLALANDPDVKAGLRSTTEEAVQRGVFGAPTTFVGEHMFFGQDRLDWIREALQGKAL